MLLKRYNKKNFNRGSSRLKEVLWVITCGILWSSWIPGSYWRVILLRLFGSKIGKGVIIKQRVRVKFPWRLQIGDFSWIGEGVWIDNLGQVKIGKNVCISQGAYLCGGSHDWTKKNFDLIVDNINIEDHAWLAAFSTVGPGVVVEKGVVLTLGSVATSRLSAWAIYAGNPALCTKSRKIIFNRDS